MASLVMSPTLSSFCTNKHSREQKTLPSAPRRYQIFRAMSVEKPLEELYKVRVERNVSKERLAELGVSRWSMWKTEKCKLPWDWHIDQLVYVEEGEVRVVPEGSQRYMSFVAGDLVHYPKWFEADLFFNDFYQERELGGVLSAVEDTNMVPNVTEADSFNQRIIASALPQQVNAFNSKAGTKHIQLPTKLEGIISRLDKYNKAIGAVFSRFPMEHILTKPELLGTSLKAGERTNATEVRPERALVGVTIEEESAIEEGVAITESVVYKCPSSGTSDLTVSGE